MKGKLIKRIMIASLLVSSFALAPISSVNAETTKEEQKTESDKKKEESKEVQEPEIEIPEDISEESNEGNPIGNANQVEVDIDTPASVTGERMEGNGTVVDFTTTGSRAFYTIVDNEQQVFYLIIDMDKTENNVYFLSEINRTELDGGEGVTAENNTEPTPTSMEQPEQELLAETEDETSDNNMGFLIAVIIIGIVGALAYYFLVIKKKQNKNTSEDDEDDYMSEDYDDDFEHEYEEVHEYDEVEKENEQEKMILKVYIKRHVFHLPRKQSDLTDLVTEKLYQNKKLVKSAVTKMYSISKVENENITIERNTNIFLLNLYLLVLQEKGELATLTEKITLNDEIILQRIEEKTNLNVSNVSVEEIEKLVLSYLYPVEQGPTELDTKDTEEDTEDTQEIFKNVQYSIDWIKKASSQLKK